MNKRIFGIETEFGCMTDAERVRGTSEGVAARVRDYVFDVLELGLRDIHYRDWGEPPGNGGYSSFARHCANYAAHGKNNRTQ